ncbi:ethylbenzene dehydrogenase-related protein [Desulfotalea psychrophila]|uniref:Cytochrome c-552/DMSO reductase-like haem-binding domain-containing protein n=1 Tax=Desulfotalea psychrophila (strain LSv54 / DSM 12343) TaxID=177439 RepID=Q6AIV0_DESPS|nr:ethylbenzene dehydrogenase-related protein [Desulfotalea psychrophila]CAG37730.1 unknown protein [Desulfotalea psychrophila LSv54]
MKVSRPCVASMTCAIACALLLSGCNTSSKDDPNTLYSTKISEPISLSADNPIWDKATPLKISLTETPYKPTGYKGMPQTNVVLKSLYDEKDLYIHMQYDDPTKSLDRFPWIKQKDGSWQQLMNKDQTGHENDYYEDKVGFFWNINTRGFDKKGCTISCHLTVDGMNNDIADTSAGRKYTRSADETIDMWHWKSVRTGVPFNLSHDQYVDSVADPKKNKNWGRHGDEKTSGGYTNNQTKDKTMPAYMSKTPGDTRTYLIDNEKTAFVDHFKTGDMVPGIIVEKMTGSAADIQTSQEYKNGQWTLVFKRSLTTNHPKSASQDVQFKDLKTPYYFGIAVFDNSQINHVYHEGSIKLQFK